MAVRSRIENACVDSCVRACVRPTCHAGFWNARDRVGRGSRSAEVHRVVAHVGRHRIGNRRGGILAGSALERMLAAPKKTGQQHRCQAAQEVDLGRPAIPHVHKFTPIPLLPSAIPEPPATFPGCPKLPLAPGAQAR
jgi:hypothetical protein